MEAKALLARTVRKRSRAHILDRSGSPQGEVAIYTLCDPRDVAAVRYVGQSASPRRRFMQHVTEARLWEPAEFPWWIKRESLRPLYTWIRELYAEESRLPLMSVVAWTSTGNARAEERTHILRCLVSEAALLNCEARDFREQLLLL